MSLSEDMIKLREEHGRVRGELELLKARLEETEDLYDLAIAKERALRNKMDEYAHDFLYGKREL